MSVVIAPSETRRSTLFLRLEGPLQAWGGRTIGRSRPTETVPTKSGVIGLLGAALGQTRRELNDRLGEFNRLMMAVRVDHPGESQNGAAVLRDYQTVGARIGVLAANRSVKRTASTKEFEAIISPREFMVDASFLVLLRGDPTLINELAAAVESPKWPLFLGRKRCIPGARLFAGVEHGLTFAEAIRRNGPLDDSICAPIASRSLRVVCDVVEAPIFATLLGVAGDALQPHFESAKTVVYDHLVRLDPPVHHPRIVLDFMMPWHDGELLWGNRPNLSDPLFGEPGSTHVARPCHPEARKCARKKSGDRCIFCRFEPDDPKRLHAHHVTYVRRGRERVADDSESTANDDLVMLCDECHAAVTMLEYQHGFGPCRIDPRESRWRSRIIAAREARRRDASPSRPRIANDLVAMHEAANRGLTLIESVISLKAGSSHPNYCPGNRWIANRHHVHQRLSMAFPEPGALDAAKGYGVTRDEGGFLFRLEPGPTARIVVWSCIFPDWSRAFADTAWLVQSPISMPRRLDFSTLTEGTELTFDMEANPVKRLRSDGPEGRGGARVALRDRAALEHWMSIHATSAGFEIIEGTLKVELLGRHTAHMRSGPNRHWNSARFSGRLRIRNAAVFIKALASGIGPAKAFGFGLLSIAPV